ncbi:MAG: DEAD/DEAH box helicase [Kiritimatiellia bacterium]
MTSSQTASPTLSSVHPGKANPVLQGAFLQLSPDLQRCVKEAGYHTPTPVQEQSIAPVAEGRDLIGTAQTGTGKTAAFVLPILQRLAANPQQPHKGSPRVLILAPTRELAAQIGESIETYGRVLSLSHAVIFGGVNQFHQVKALNRGLDILVATPGRLLDLMQQGYIRLNRVGIFVLDEMDRMLDMGFIRDIRKVLKEVPEQRQTLFFSATMSPQIEQLAGGMVKNPVRVSITPEEPTVDRIEQKIMFIQPADKARMLVKLIQGQDVEKVIVFTQMKHAANKVVDSLTEAGIRAAAIHGNKSQAARIKALDGFKRGRFQVLVATDVAARGLDVDDITHVVNYDMPVEAETYVHRIGRTARAGADGDAISFVSPEDRSYLTQVEKLLGTQIPVDLTHEYHSDEARFSTLKPKVPGRGRSGGRDKNRSRNKPEARRGRQMGAPRRSRGR